MTRDVTRRRFLKTVSASAAVLAAGTGSAGTGPTGVLAADSKPAQTALPRWRGFNLLNFFQALGRSERNDGRIREDDCRMIRDMGFDFIRIPMDYWMWIDSDCRRTGKLRVDDMAKIREGALEQVDRTVEVGDKFGLHVSLNFHRAPGYCINNPEREPAVLWSDRRAEGAFVHHWDVFAKRYQGVSAKKLSFNLVNEAPRAREGYMTREDYCRVMSRATEAIRRHSPKRPIIIDGLSVGNVVVDEMISTGVAQSVHGYRPAGISHYRASWVDRNESFPEPTWPQRKKDGSVLLDRAGLERHYAPWAELAQKGIGVHCGECGGYNRTPHKVFLAWMRDVLEILTTCGIGYALWNFRGSFGVLDSGRRDVEYEEFHGHQLDRKLLALLQEN